MILNKNSWFHNEDKALADTMLEMSQVDGVTIEDGLIEASKRIGTKTLSACQNRWYIIRTDLQALYNRIEEFDRKSASNNEQTEEEIEQDKEDYLNDLLNNNIKKKEEPVLVGVYLEKRVADLLDLLGKKGGRGTKSRVVNECLRNIFLQKGLM